MDPLEKAWNSTCRVLFGAEVGPLTDFKGWLSEYLEDLPTGKSSVSGKRLRFSIPDYAPSAAFLAFEEVDFEKKFEPLSINQMKDIDSIAQAISERAAYAGNVVLGNCSNITDSTSVNDSHYVLDSYDVVKSKYVACTRYIREGEYIFGIFGCTNGSHLIKCMGSELRRCFECHMVEVLADCYYCSKTQNCTDCMFCFGTENARNCIGNTKMAPEKYRRLKEKLVGEIADALRKKKSVISLLSLIEACGGAPADRRLKFKKPPEPHFDMSPIQKAFSQTGKLLFGTELGDLRNYDAFLKRHIPMDIVQKSALSGAEVVACGYRRHLPLKYKLEQKTATEDEMREIGKVGIGEEKAAKISMDEGTLVELLGPIAYFNLDKVAGQVRNIKEASVVIGAQDCYKGSAFIWSKKCAYCFWPTYSEALFGISIVHDSTYCMNCYYCKGMTRSFECNGCDNCADAYYLHNCENVRDSMFCFNAKNLTFAIGNAALPPEQYRKVKSSIVSQLADELEKKKDIALDIFNVGAGRKP